MKRFFAAILVLALCGGLFGCGSNSSSIGDDFMNDGYDEASQTEPTTTEPPTTAKSVDMKLTEYTFTATTSTKYEIRTTLRVGQWVRTNDREQLNAMWRAVGGTGEFPWDTTQGAEIRQNGLGTDGWYSKMEWDNTNAAVFFGTLTYKNITPGFSLSSTYAIKLGPIIHFDKPDKFAGQRFDMITAVPYREKIWYNIGRIGSERSGSFGLSFHPLEMASDTLGPIPFAVAIVGLPPSPQFPYSLNDYLGDIKFSFEDNGGLKPLFDRVLHSINIPKSW